MDPVVIAQDGVQKFKSDNFEIIIVDTRYSIDVVKFSVLASTIVVVINRRSLCLKKCFKCLMQL